MTLYSRSTHVMSSEYDGAFRFLITADWADKKMGSVEEPQGHLSALSLDMISVQDYATDEDWRSLLLLAGENVPSNGHYIAHENITGQIVVFAYENAADLEADWVRLEDEVNSFSTTE